MKGDNMKKLIAILLVLLMITPSALALDLTDFNMYAEIFGENELKGGVSSQTKNGVFTFFNFEGGQVAFREVDGSINSISVYGKGDIFITYCCAAIMAIDQDSSHAVQNFGFFTFYLQMKKGNMDGEKDEIFSLANGSTCGISSDDQYGCRFMVIK